jgi:hypothetical protein
MPTTVVSPVFAASDFESTSMPEVRALYADRVQAERHAAGPPCALSAEELEGETSSPSARPESAIVDVRPFTRAIIETRVPAGSCAGSRLLFLSRDTPTEVRRS